MGTDEAGNLDDGLRGDSLPYGTSKELTTAEQSTGEAGRKRKRKQGITPSGGREHPAPHRGREMWGFLLGMVVGGCLGVVLLAVLVVGTD